MKKQWILLRGLAREQGHWGEFKDQLQKQYPQDEVLGVDLPGAGEFHRLSSPLSVEGLAEFVHSQLKGRLGPEAYLVAISLGGMVAVEMVRLYPKEFKGLVLINSSFKNLSPIHHRLQLEALPHMYRALTATDHRTREQAVLDMVSNREDRYEVLNEWVRIAEERPVSALNALKQLVAAGLYEAPLQKPDLPVVLLTSYGDRMVDPRCSQKLAEQWKVPLEIHRGGGHELCFDDPQWVIEQIKKYFA